MKSKWSKKWRASKQPRKQRKYRFNAPLHIRHRMMSAPLSKDLRKKHSARNIPLAKKDKVKILRGKFKGTIGDIEEISLERLKVFVKGAEFKKEEGRAIRYPIDPSNVIIIELNLSDKERKNALEKNKGGKK
jgi:large subunit ribosomal protein L24